MGTIHTEQFHFPLTDADGIEHTAIMEQTRDTTKVPEVIGPRSFNLVDGTELRRLARGRYQTLEADPRELTCRPALDPSIDP